MPDENHPHEQTIAEAYRQGPHPMKKYLWLAIFLAIVGGSVASWEVTHKTAPPIMINGDV